MSKIKRFVSAMTTAAIFATMVSATAFAGIPADIIGTPYEDAAKVLGAFGIMVGDGTNFRADDDITRSEVTKVAVALKGLSDAANANTQTKFPDVKEGHWATGFINIGTAEGLIVGDDMGNFRPDDKISYNEAVTILVRALGYEPQAQSKGGYPAGYLSAGSTTGLTSGVAVAARSAGTTTRGQVALLAYNAMNINLMEQTGYGDKISYEVTDETPVSAYHDAQKIEGVVTAVGSSALEGAGVEKDEIVIDGKTYKAGSADVRNVLGLTVDAYVSTSSKSKNTLKAIVPSKYKNSYSIISADDIDSVDKGSSYVTITYFKNNRKDKVTIPSDSYVVYNGKSASLDDITMIESGAIMIADYEKGRKIVFVNETQNYVVDEVIKTSSRITDKYGKSPITLDADDDSMTFVIEKGGRSIGIEELSEWDVITLTVSKDKKSVFGSVTNEVTQGLVTEIDDEYVHIGDKKHKVAKSYPHEIKLGDEGKFHLDAEGKIAAFDKSVTAEKDYAYITKAGISSGLDSRLEIEMLTIDGKISRYETAEKIKIDGKTYSDASSALKALGEEEQLVIAQTNESGKISEITKSITSEDIDEDEFVKNFAFEGAVYTEKTSSFELDDAAVKADESTVVFDIPKKAESTDDYTVTDKSIFSDGGKYDIIVFDVKEDLTAGVIIVTSTESKVNEESSAIVVEKLTTSKDDDGNSITKLYGYVDGQRLSYTADAGVFVKDGTALECGDIIQVKADSKGHVKAMTLLFDTSKAETEFSAKLSDDHSIVYGKVTKKFASSFNLSADGGTSKNYAIGDANIYVVDSESKKTPVSVGDSADIQKFDDEKPERVFVRMYKGEVVDIVVIR